MDPLEQADQSQVLVKKTELQVVAHNVEQDRLSLSRRYIFASCTTAANMAIILILMWRGTDGLMAQRVVDAAYSYMELMACLLLGASVIDRTRLIDKIVGPRFGGPGHGPEDGPDFNQNIRGPQ